MFSTSTSQSIQFTPKMVNHGSVVICVTLPKTNRASPPQNASFQVRNLQNFQGGPPFPGFRECIPHKPVPPPIHGNLRAPLPSCHPQQKELRPYEESTLEGTNTSRFQGTFEDDFPFPQVGYVNSLEGINHHHPLIRQLGNFPEIPPQPLGPLWLRRDQ